MTYALDTNTIIHLLKHTPSVLTWRDSELANGAKLIIPPYVNYELKRGFRYVKATAKERSYKILCSRYPVGEMRYETWDLAATIYSDLRLAKYTIGDADILIAAFCIVDGYTLVTNNTKDFQNISNLQLVDWV